MKRLPSKTQRSKGFRAKHALQICLLLGVCFWLVYQVKHSHDKKKEFDDEKKVGSTVSVQKEETLKLGRKDLPREEPEKKIIPEEEEEEEVEDDKHEEERENPNEEEEEESREEDPGNGDDELDENGQNKRDLEENGEDKRDLEENGESDEDRAIENESSLEDQVVENIEGSSESDGGDDHEAREEHYRGDDASSEVAHGEEEPREASALNGTKSSENRISGNSTTSSNLASLVLEKVEDEKESEAKRSDDELPIVVTESRNSSAVEVRDNSTEALDSSLQNRLREDSTNATVGENVKEQPLLVEQTNNTDSEKVNDLDSSETEYTDESSKKESADRNGGSEKEEEEEEGSNSSEKGDEGSGEEEPEEESGTHEVMTEHDPIDSTDTHEVMIGQEMNEARTDLDTLPDLKSHGDDSEEEVAAE